MFKILIHMRTPSNKPFFIYISLLDVSGTQYEKKQPYLLTLKIENR